MIRPRRASLRPAFAVPPDASEAERRAAVDLWMTLHGVERVPCGRVPDVAIACKPKGYTGGRGPRQGGRKL